MVGTNLWRIMYTSQSMQNTSLSLFDHRIGSRVLGEVEYPQAMVRTGHPTSAGAELPIRAHGGGLKVNTNGRVLAHWKPETPSYETRMPGCIFM